MSSKHNQEHIRMREQIDGIIAILNNQPPPAPTPAPTPTPTPAPTPAPAGDTFSFTSGSMPANCTLTRSTVGWHNTSTPYQLAQKAIDTARFNYVPATGVLLGLLFEQTQENLLQYGRSPGSTGWTNIGSGLTRTTGRTDPLGGTDAVRLQAAAGSNAIYQGITSATGVQLASLYAKSASGAQHLITVRDPQTNAWTEAPVYPDRFQRIAYVGTGTSFFNFTIGAASSVALDVDVWGGDFYESGAHYFVSPYPSNAAATATRGQDVLTFTGLTNGTRDIEIDWRDGNSVDSTFYIYGVTVAGATYVLEADDVSQYGMNIRAVRFTGGSPPAPTPSPTPTPTPAPAPSTPSAPTTIFRSQMESLNEALPIFYMNYGRAGFADGSFKYCGGFVHKMGEPSTTGTLVLRPWFIVMAVDDGSGDDAYSAAPNSLLELSWFRTHRRSPPAAWTKIYERQDTGEWFDWYDKNQGAQGGTSIPNTSKTAANRASTSSGKLLVPLNAFIDGDYTMLHGGSADTFNFDLSSGDWISQQIQARIIMADSGGTDDRANIPICINIGCDRTNGRLDEYMHGSVLTIPSNGTHKLITATNMDVYKACASCGGNVGGVNKACYDYTLGEMTGSELDANPPPVPAFGS